MTSTWPLNPFAGTRGTFCPLPKQPTELGRLLAPWDRLERRRCSAASPKCASITGALHRFLGWKDLQQSTFCGLPKSDDSGNWRRWEFRRNVSVSGWEPTGELGLLPRALCGACSMHRLLPTYPKTGCRGEGEQQPFTGAGEHWRGSSGCPQVPRTLCSAHLHPPAPLHPRWSSSHALDVWTSHLVGVTPNCARNSKGRWGRAFPCLPPAPSPPASSSSPPSGVCGAHIENTDIELSKLFPTRK